MFCQEQNKNQVSANLERTVAGKKKRVLLVEVSRELRAAYTEMLIGAGFEVTGAYGLEESRIKIAGPEWDVLVWDTDSERSDGPGKKDGLTKLLKGRPVIVLATDPANVPMEPSGYLDSLNSSPGEVVDLVRRVLGDES